MIDKAKRTTNENTAIVFRFVQASLKANKERTLANGYVKNSMSAKAMSEPILDRRKKRKSALVDGSRINNRGAGNIRNFAPLINLLGSVVHHKIGRRKARKRKQIIFIVTVDAVGAIGKPKAAHERHRGRGASANDAARNFANTI